MQHYNPDRPVKLRYNDLKRMNIVGSRSMLRDMVIRGQIRKPHKDGKHFQSGAWWYWDEIMEDLEKERQRFNAEATKGEQE